MGYVEKRGKNSWRIVTHVKVGGVSQPLRVPLRMDPALPESVQRREAERELAKLEKRLAREVSDEYTVRQWSDVWLSKHLDADASPVTIANYRYLLDSRILPKLGDLLLTDLTPVLLTDWLHNLKQEKRKTTRKTDDKLKRPRRSGEKLIPTSKIARPLSVKTGLLDYGCMKTMLAAAVRVGQLEHNPMDRVQRPKKRKKKKQIMSEAEAVALLQLILTEAPKPLMLSVLLAMLCGLRLGEVGGLQYFAVDWDAETITISQALKYTPAMGAFLADPKTDAGARVITLPHSMIRILHDAMWDDIMEAQDDPEHWQGKRWIVHSRHGARVNKDTPSKWFRAFADAHGFQGVTFHDLRHVHASMLIAKHMDVATVAARMGHSDPAVTLSVYTDALPPRDQDSAATLDALLLEASHADPEDDPAS